MCILQGRSGSARGLGRTVRAAESRRAHRWFCLLAAAAAGASLLLAGCEDDDDLYVSLSFD